MRILIAAHGFPPTHSAGAERRAERMALWLTRQNHYVEVFAAEKLDEPGFRVETGQQDGFTIHRLFYDVKSGEDPFRNLYDYPPIGEAFHQVLARGQFDLVHVVSGYLLGGQVIHTAQEMGIPVIVTLTEYWFMCTRLNLIQATGALCSGPESDTKCARCLMEDKRRYRLLAMSAPRLMDAFWSIAHKASLSSDMAQAVAQRRETLQEALNAADLVICPSQYLMNTFQTFAYDTSRYTFLRQGLATPAGDKPTVNREPGGELRLGYIGQIKPHKGVDLLIEAVINLLESGEKVSLDLWGSETEAADYVSELKQRSAQWEMIRWNGRYTGAKVWEVLAGFDVLVIPSRWYENSPNVILEAYEMGIPVIATNLGGMAELVEHQRTGLLFRLNDAEDLQGQIARLLHEPGLIEQFRGNIPHVKTIDEEMQELTVYYQELIKQAG